MNNQIEVFHPVNESDNNTFGNLTKGVDLSEYIKSFEKEKSHLVYNYKSLRRFKMKKNSSNFLFLNPNEDAIPQSVSLKIAHKRLESFYWRKIFTEKKLLRLMSHKEKQKWNLIFENSEVPSFNYENLISSIQEVLNSSTVYFGQRICLALESLSKDHLTNSQFGFGEKIIIKDIHSGMTNSRLYPSLDFDKYSAFEEIRKIVSFLLSGNIDSLDEGLSTYNLLDACLDSLRSDGKSEFFIDNGNIMIKVFKVGTIHLFISPEVAEKMNYFVSALYPNMLPSTITEKSYFKGKMKKQTLKSDPVSQTVIRALTNLKTLQTKEFRDKRFTEDNIFYLNSKTIDSIKEQGLLDELNSVINKMGGKLIEVDKYLYYSFPYPDLKKVVNEIMIAGGVDNTESYQQFYTQDKLANDAYKFMTDGYAYEEIYGFDYLEPSCGSTGGLMNKMPKDRVKGVDISKINVAVRKAQGFNVVLEDFVEYAKSTDERFDMILSNPPFKNNQAYNHTLLSLSLLKEQGTIVSILPSSMRDQFDHLIDDDIEIFKSKDYIDAFENTKIKVFLLKIVKHSEAYIYND